MIRLKDSTVKLGGATPEIVFALTVAGSIFERSGYDLIVTSICDDAENRAPASRHRVGLAADIRRWNVPEAFIEDLVTELRDALPGVVVILETDHIHIQING